jgi:DsrE/DsrF-like family
MSRVSCRAADLLGSAPERGDAVGCAMAHQQVPDGYYHLDRMIESVARHGADIGCCTSCLDARGITDDMLTKGAERSSFDELADWTLWADKISRSKRAPSPGAVARQSRRDDMRICARGACAPGSLVADARVGDLSGSTVQVSC